MSRSDCYPPPADVVVYGDVESVAIAGVAPRKQVVLKRSDQLVGRA